MPLPGLELGKDYRAFNRKQWYFLYKMYKGGPVIKTFTTSIYNVKLKPRGNGSKRSNSVRINVNPLP